jgi:hypothetical protein
MFVRLFQNDKFLVKRGPQKLSSITLLPAEHFPLEYARPLNLS